MKKKYSSTIIIYVIHFLISLESGVIKLLMPSGGGIIDFPPEIVFAFMYLVFFPLATGLTGIVNLVTDIITKTKEYRGISWLCGVLGIFVLLAFWGDRELYHFLPQEVVLEAEKIMVPVIWCGSVVIVVCWGIKFILQIKKQKQMGLSWKTIFWGEKEYRLKRMVHYAGFIFVGFLILSVWVCYILHIIKFM